MNSNAPESGDEPARGAARSRMVERQLVARGIKDPRVLSAMRTVPRHRMIPAPYADHAYEDGPLPIGEGQTISQPYVVAATAEAAILAPPHRVLEVGTGSGYSAAVLSRLCARVFSVERHRVLADAARAKLLALGYDNVAVKWGDGTLGWPEEAPFDAIIVTASGPTVPETLLAQLAPGGRLVIPVGGSEDNQQLLRVTRTRADILEYESLMGVRFVRLIGQAGWPEPEL